VAIAKKVVKKPSKDFDDDSATEETSEAELSIPPLLLEQIAFQPEELIEAAATQPSLFEAAASWRVRVMRARMTADTALKSTSAGEAQSIRDSYVAAGGKLTEAGLQENLQLNKKVQRATADLQKLQELEAYALLVLEALRMRRDSLLVLGMGGNAPLKLLRDRLREKYSGLGGEDD